jgi:hypothetical protein
MPWPLSTSGKDPVPIVQDAGWAAGPVWTGVENLAPTGIFFFGTIFDRFDRLTVLTVLTFFLPF